MSRFHGPLPLVAPSLTHIYQCSLFERLRGWGVGDGRAQACALERFTYLTQDASQAALCEGVGIRAVQVQLPASSTFAAVHDTIMALNRRADVDAIILERPVPHTLDADMLGSYITACKDVDNERRELGYAEGGLQMASQGIFHASPDVELDLALEGKDQLLAHPVKPQWLSEPPAVMQCTVAGVMHLLHRSQLLSTVSSGLTVVVGRSPQLGAPLARELVKANGTVVVCHSQSSKALLKTLCKMANLLVVAAGCPGLITKDMVKEGAVVINCGTTFSPSLNQLQPDVESDVEQVARFLTPTPHGVGPTCAAALTLNTLTLAEAAARRRHLEARHKQGPATGISCTKASCSSLAAIPQWEQSVCPTSGQTVMRRIFKRSSFASATQLIVDMTVLAERANHHPTLSLNPSRTCETDGGCDLVVELSTYSNKQITMADVALALRFDALA